MLKLRPLKTLFLSGLVLAGCAGKTVTFVPAATNVEKGSIVYIYRPHNSANFMMSPRVVLDENEKFQIGSGKYRYLYMQEGMHSVVLSSTEQYDTEEPVKLLVEPGESYYLRVNTTLKFNPEGMNNRWFEIEQVTEKSALAEIGDTSYSGPKRSEGKTVEKRVSTTDGFTIDKTQDPFAGKN